MEAKVSGRDVPSATAEIAVTVVLRPTVQPKTLAKSPTTNVQAPIIARAPRKQAHPPIICGGGTMEKRSFHPIVAK